MLQLYRFSRNRRLDETFHHPGYGRHYSFVDVGLMVQGFPHPQQHTGAASPSPLIDVAKPIGFSVFNVVSQQREFEQPGNDGISTIGMGVVEPQFIFLFTRQFYTGVFILYQPPYD